MSKIEGEYLDINTSISRKLEIMEDELYNIFGMKARWDTVSFDDEPSRYDIANYDFYNKSFLSKVPNKKQMYIEYLKCYLRVLADPYFYETVPSEYEFIKSKCEEYDLLDVFKEYYKINSQEVVK